VQWTTNTAHRIAATEFLQWQDSLITHLVATEIDVPSDVVPLTVKGHSTQTNDIFLVEKEDSTDLFKVSETAVTFGVLLTANANILMSDGGEIQDAGGTERIVIRDNDSLEFVDDGGTIRIEIDNTAPFVDITGNLLIDGVNADEVQLTVQGAVSQSANVFVVENSGTGDLFVVSGVGNVGHGSAAVAQRGYNMLKTIENASTNYGMFLFVNSLTRTSPLSLAVGVGCVAGSHSSSNVAKTSLVGGLFSTQTAGTGRITNSIGGDFLADVLSPTSTLTEVTNLIAGRFGFNVDRQRSDTGIHIEIVEPAGAAVDTGNGGTLATQYGMVIRELTLGTSTIIPLFQEGTTGTNILNATTIVEDREVNRYAYSV
jgi:hypothetical protein